MKTLLFEQEKGIGILTINRPESLNALNLNVLKELKQFIIEQDAALRALIITGSGEKAFVAGADIKEMQAMSASKILAFIHLGQEVTHLIENAPFLTLAAVNGFALGGGLELALACDFIYASETAKLGLPEVTLGIIPGFGGTQRLCRAVGTRRAKELVLTGKPIEAEEAREIGLVNHVNKPEALIGACWTTAERVAKHSALAVSQGKSAINHGCSLPLREALELEKNQFAVCFASSEREQAMATFLEKTKRKANA